VTTRVETEAFVRVYEVNGKEQKDMAPLSVRTHWNDEQRVVLKTSGGSSLTVFAGDLLTAIKRCTR